MSIELKIKSKHLSVEAQIIRFEENKLKKQIAYWREKSQAQICLNQKIPEIDALYEQYTSLNSHRRFDVRNENRATYLARAYLVGVPYKNLEKSRKDDIKFMNHVVPRVVDMINKYKKYDAPKVDRNTIYTWADV